MELYAITVHYIYSRCFEKIYKESELLEVESWVVPLHKEICEQMYSEQKEASWSSNADTSKKYLRHCYDKIKPLLEQGNLHAIVKLSYHTFKPILLFSGIGDRFNELDQLFKPRQFPPKYELTRSKGKTTKIKYSVTRSDLDKIFNKETHQAFATSTTSVSLSQQIPNQQPLLYFRVPIRLDFFLGRTTLLAEIHERLTNPQIYTNILLLNGIGGMGKTTVMQVYLHSLECKNHFQRIIFAANDKNLKSAFIDAAARVLEIEDQVKEFVHEEEKLNFITSKLSKIDRNNLFVLDNVNESDYDDLLSIKSYLLETGWKFLITTRTKPDGFSALDVNELDDSDAALLFAYHFYPGDIESISRDKQEKELLRFIAEKDLGDPISKLLDHIVKHTLLIELLAKAGKKKGLSVAELLKSLEEQDFKHPVLQRVINIGPHAKRLSNDSLQNYLLGMFETEYLEIKTGNELIDNENYLKATMLRFFSLLPAEDIPLNDLCILWGVEQNQVNEFEDRLDQLKQIGWLQGKKEKQTGNWKLDLQKVTYKMHLLIQKVVYEKLQPTIENCSPLVRSVKYLLDVPLISPEAYQHYAQSIISKLIDLQPLLNLKRPPNES